MRDEYAKGERDRIIRISKVDPLKGNLITTFFRYSAPNIAGLIAITSSIIVDGIFVGRIVGSDALAAVNLAMPFFSLSFGICALLVTGGSVLCGEMIGAGDDTKASQAFSQVVLVLFTLSLIICAAGFLFPHEVAKLLGADQRVINDVVTYLTGYLLFIPIVLSGMGLLYFARVNGFPELVSFVLLFVAVLNVLLDWLLVAKWNMGLKGAALATGGAQSMIFVLLLPSFFFKSSRLRFMKPSLDIRHTLRASFNGLSEFFNETSGGIVIFTFNYVLMRRVGVDGVAAFTIVNYLMFVGLMVAYGVGESLHAPVSINLGAGAVKRATDFLRVAVVFILVAGMILALCLLVMPQALIGIFLTSGEPAARLLAVDYTRYLWPAFLFNGVNITMSAYFTAMQKPVQSIVIALMRSLFLPVVLILLFNRFFSHHFIFMSIPAAEIITLAVAVIMLRGVINGNHRHSKSQGQTP
jgi:putative MATE family efflux protein